MIKRTMHIVTLASALGTIFFAFLYGYSRNTVSFTVAISFGVTFYHLAMRLLLGQIIGIHLAPYICTEHRWFREKPFERRWYKALKVKKWKKRVPSYAPHTFQLRKDQLADVVTTMCVSEIVHEAIIICSFLPILFSLVVGKLPVFLITSTLAAAVDCVFVVMQRFNRPRLLKLLEKNVGDNK